MAVNPMKIKDHINNIKNPRQVHMKEENDKNLKFEFTRFKTEKERIKDLENVKGTMENMQKVSIMNVIPEKKQSGSLLMKQPTMRFKPRDDIERLFDSIDIYGDIRKMHKWIPIQNSSSSVTSFSYLKKNSSVDNLKDTKLKEGSLSKENHDYLYDPTSDEFGKTKILKKNFSENTLTRGMYTNKYWVSKSERANKMSKILYQHNNKTVDCCKTHFKGVQDFTMFYETKCNTSFLIIRQKPNKQ